MGLYTKRVLVPRGRFTYIKVIVETERLKYLGYVQLLMVHNKLSKVECLNELKRVSSLVGGTLSKRKFRELGNISDVTIENKFGTWNNAKEAAGLKTNRSSKLKYQEGVPEILNISKEEWNDMHKNVRSRRRKQAKIAKIKVDKGCKKCGYDDNPVALDFHHRVPNEKKMCVAQLVGQGYSLSIILEEVEKCDILCSNCHRIEESPAYLV